MTGSAARRASLQGTPGQDDTVGHLPTGLQEGPKERRHEDGNLSTAGGEPEIEAFDSDNATLKGHGAVAEECPHDLDRLSQTLDRLDERDTVLALDLDAVARPEAKDKPPARQVIDGGRGHGDGGRTPHEDAADGGAELDGPSGHGTRGEDGKLVASMPLRHPCRLVAELLRQPDALDDLGGVSPPVNAMPIRDEVMAGIVRRRAPIADPAFVEVAHGRTIARDEHRAGLDGSTPGRPPALLASGSLRARGDGATSIRNPARRAARALARFSGCGPCLPRRLQPSGHRAFTGPRRGRRDRLPLPRLALPERRLLQRHPPTAGSHARPRQGSGDRLSLPAALRSPLGRPQ